MKGLEAGVLGKFWFGLGAGVLGKFWFFEVELEFCMWDPLKKLRKAIKNSFCG